MTINRRLDEREIGSKKKRGSLYYLSAGKEKKRKKWSLTHVIGGRILDDKGGKNRRLWQRKEEGKEESCPILLIPTIEKGGRNYFFP